MYREGLSQLRKEITEALNSKKEKRDFDEDLHIDKPRRDFYSEKDFEVWKHDDNIIRGTNRVLMSRLGIPIDQYKLWSEFRIPRGPAVLTPRIARYFLQFEPQQETTSDNLVSINYSPGKMDIGHYPVFVNKKYAKLKEIDAGYVYLKGGSDENTAFVVPFVKIDEITRESVEKLVLVALSNPRIYVPEASFIRS